MASGGEQVKGSISITLSSVCIISHKGKQLPDCVGSPFHPHYGYIWPCFPLHPKQSTSVIINDSSVTSLQ